MPQPHSALPNTAKRNAIVLSFAQAVNGSIAAIAVSLGAFAGDYLLPNNPEFATVPVAAMSIGLALFAVPVALACKKFGRRFGFIIGAMIGIVGALLATTALINTWFVSFCLAMFLIGGLGAFVQQYRFAAADQGDDDFKSRAISWVMTGGVIAAIIGPQTALVSKDLLLPTPFAGAYLAAALLLVIGIIILTFMKPIGEHSQFSDNAEPGGRPLPQIIKQPKFIVALICATSSFALMTFVMTGAPLAMEDHGHSVDDAIKGIQWHILAMYGPSFFTGLLIVRFGKLTIISAGLTLLLLCAIVAMSGIELWNFWLSLILLGLGWNFGFIGSTALLAETYSSTEKNKVQGLHDLILFSCVAMASLLSGAALHLLGWNGLTGILIPVVSLGLVSVLWLSLHERKPARMSGDR